MGAEVALFLRKMTHFGSPPSQQHGHRKQYIRRADAFYVPLIT